MHANPEPRTARLEELGLISVAGVDARAFLHSQLTCDVEHLAPQRAAYGGWCSAKGRLLATLLIVPYAEGFLLQLSRDLAEPVRQRLQKFVLRAKVRLEDASDAWAQFGVWRPGPPPLPLDVEPGEKRIAVRIDAERVLLISQDPVSASHGAAPWMLAEICAGRPRVTLATQDQFVPQMLNEEMLGAVDFHKGCYPGQEVVARAQYRGQLKRRMYRVRASIPLRVGQDLFSDDAPGQPSGSVVNAADGEALAVLPIAAAENKVPVRAAPGASPLEILPLPYSP